MKKKYGVCFGMLAMGLAVLGAPVSSRRKVVWLQAKQQAQRRKRRLQRR